MFSKTTKKLTVLGASLLLFAASAMTFTTLTANAETAEETISSHLTPVRATEYGNETELIIEGGKAYKNYEYGCIMATLGSNNDIISARDFGGVNYDKTSKKLEFLKSGEDYKLKPMILNRGVEADVKGAWNKLATKFDSSVEYNTGYALQKIYEKYAKMCEEGYNCGIATDNLSVWDGSVIKLDFYDGDGKYGFDSARRVHVTTIAYSFLRDEAFAIYDEVFNFYREAKAGSLSEPITDTFDYTENGVKGSVQAFALGYIFCPENGADKVVRAGTRWNFGKNRFEVIEMSYDDLTATDMGDEALNDSPYYANKGFTMEDVLDANGKVVKEGVKTKFYNKYTALIKAGFNPGIPDHEGIYYWDTELLKQAYVGSDGTGNAWGRTNMMLILNPDDGQVYAVYGDILNIVDKASHGLGNARSLGYPTSDPRETTINGLKYTYQNFYRPYYVDEEKSTIYCIENTKQLTRHIVGKNFEELMADGGKLKPNNPLYFYVLEPWIIALICVVSVVLCGGGAAAFVILKKKKLGVKSVVAETIAGELPKTTEAE